MSKFFTLLVLSFIVSFAVKAQNDTLAYYMANEVAIAKTKDSAKFIRVIVMPAKKTGHDLYYIGDLYLNGQVKCAATSTVVDVAFQRGLVGECLEYYENGNKKSIAQYKDGREIGNTTLYYPNGNVYTIKNYDNKDHIVLTLCRDSTGQILAENGNGLWIEYDKDFKTVIMKGNVVNGLQDGEWHGTFESVIEHNYTFSKGKFISQYPLPLETDTIRAGLVRSDSEMQAKYGGGGIDKLYSFIAQNLRYPARARENNVQGKIFISFVIEKDGSVTNVKVIRGIGSGCDDEAMRVLKLMPKWTSATKYGVPVRVQYNIPISFSIAPEEVIYLK